MRGIDTPVRKMRREIFKEIAQLAYHSDNLNDDVEALPYKIVNPETPIYRESIYREREIVREQIRLAMGLSLRPEDAPVHVTQGLEESNIDEKYYEPPMIQVIPSACNACPENEYCVTDRCMGCVAHPCQVVCPRGAISTVNGKSVIDQSKCIRCGKCKSVCPYDAVSHQQRPCSAACGVGAIGSDGAGRAVIDSEKCVTCGQCMVSCPFGAIADKSQIFQLIHALESGREIIAQVAPAFVGQFGPAATPGKIKTALKQLGFADVYETAIGADIGAATEAEHYVKEVATGELPFLLTSCCPSWSMLAKKFFPETIDKISNALTPMVATARVIKQEHPDASVVFIGPCVAKKLEASRRSVRSDVDFVITHPEGYELDPKFVRGAKVEYNQMKAFEGADFIYAKNWSAYKDPNYGQVISTDRSWTVDAEKMALTNNAYFMHCLPVRRNMIVSDDVIESPQSIVIPEAANREISAQTVLKKILMGLSNL